MNKIEAEKILKEYGEAFSNDEILFRKESNLPHSKAKIRSAFYIYIEALISPFKTLPEELRHTLTTSYSELNNFIPDQEADRLNKIGQLILSKKLDPTNPDHEKLSNEYFSALINGTDTRHKNEDEINEYIEEAYKANKIK